MSSSVSSEQQGQISKDIPVRKVVVSDPNQLPLDYGTTPGGTIFSTTPGGTRIVYERKFLLQCRNSPHSMSPPCSLPTIPGVTEPEEEREKMSAVAEESASGRAVTPKENIAPADVRKSQERSDGMFDMDM